MNSNSAGVANLMMTSVLDLFSKHLRW